MKRVLNYELIDEHYLHNVFIPSYDDQSSKSSLSNSVKQLEVHLIEFRHFMHQVEDGKIPVTLGGKGEWRSYINKDGAWIYAGYGPEGVVSDFQKHRNQYPFPMIYEFRFSTNGYLWYATTIIDGFRFDEHGKVQKYWHRRK
jgi:hypothetical protein